MYGLLRREFRELLIDPGGVPGGSEVGGARDGLVKSGSIGKKGIFRFEQVAAGEPSAAGGTGRSIVMYFVSVP